MGGGGARKKEEESGAIILRIDILVDNVHTCSMCTILILKFTAESTKASLASSHAVAISVSSCELGRAAPVAEFESCKAFDV